MEHLITNKSTQPEQNKIDNSSSHISITSHHIILQFKNESASDNIVLYIVYLAEEEEARRLWREHF